MNISNEITNNEGRDAGTSRPSENLKTRTQTTMKNRFVNAAITQPSGFVENYVDDHCLILSPSQFLQFSWCGESVQPNRVWNHNGKLGLLDMSRSSFLAKVKSGELAVHPVKLDIRATVHSHSETLAILRGM